jgi:hypothetical protein
MTEYSNDELRSFIVEYNDLLNNRSLNKKTVDIEDLTNSLEFRNIDIYEIDYLLNQ